MIRCKARPALYATFYPKMRQIARRYGWALCVHGSMGRDLDLVMVPWAQKFADSETVLSAFRKYLGCMRQDRQTMDSWEHKPHGRTACTIGIGAGAYLDISIIAPAD